MCAGSSWMAEHWLYGLEVDLKRAFVLEVLWRQAAEAVCLQEFLESGSCPRVCAWRVWSGNGVGGVVTILLTSGAQVSQTHLLWPPCLPWIFSGSPRSPPSTAESQWEGTATLLSLELSPKRVRAARKSSRGGV